jgi:hypothetical protein
MTVEHIEWQVTVVTMVVVSLPKNISNFSRSVGLWN